MDSELLDILNELEQLTTKGKSFLGNCFINEEEFWLSTTKLKVALPNHFKALEAVPPAEISLQCLFLIDKLESTVESSPKLPLSIMAIIDPQLYHSNLAKLREALTNDLKTATELAATNPTAPARTISDARAEAQRIIAEAQAEAEQILAEARQHAE